MEVGPKIPHVSDFFERLDHTLEYLWVQRSVSTVFGIFMIIIFTTNIIIISKFLSTPTVTTNNKNSEIYVCMQRYRKQCHIVVILCVLSFTLCTCTLVFSKFKLLISIIYVNIYIYIYIYIYYLFLKIHGQ